MPRGSRLTRGSFPGIKICRKGGVVGENCCGSRREYFVRQLGVESFNETRDWFVNCQVDGASDFIKVSFLVRATTCGIETIELKQKSPDKFLNSLIRLKLYT